MLEDEYIQHWNYFCSLTSRLDETKNYVFHGVEQDPEGKMDLIHGNVYSDSFKQIIILTASEFEIICKAICNENGESAANIVEMSRIILKRYPKIVNAEVMTMYWMVTPLADWEVIETDSKKVKGLPWWDAYNLLKHNEVNSYKSATLKNAVESLSALYILNLYLMYIFNQSLAMAYYYPPTYFRCKYMPSPVASGEGLLPDFGNKTAEEVTKSMFAAKSKAN